MKKTKRIISLLLSGLMAMSVATVGVTGVSAKEISSQTVSESNVITGECGNNAKWSLDESTGVLTITGTGAMTDYDAHVYDGEYYNNSIFYKYRKTIKSVVIAEGITRIGKNAFEECQYLTNIIIPTSITSIGERAFYYTGYYKNSNNWDNNLLYIGEYLIEAKSYVSEYNIKDGTKFICDGVFRDYDADRTFTTITIPNSVKSIGNNVFQNCSELDSIIFPERLECFGKNVFDGCINLKSIELPEGVTTIDSDMFHNCWRLKSITIPSTVTNIEDCAFLNCYNLSDITVNENNSNYSSLDGVLYNKDKTTLIQYAIGKTDTSFKIPSSVTSIGSCAFEGCTSLTSVTIPDSVISIGGKAFYETGYYNDSNNWENGVLYIDKYLVNADEWITECNIKTDTKLIADGAFENCYNLTSVLIPDSVTSIGSRAYYKKIKNVYYPSTEEQWKAIVIADDNEYLNNATIHYNFNPSLAKKAASLKAGKTANITVNNASDVKESYKSSNSKVAKVTSKGTVTALKKGSAKITVTVGGTKLTYTVKVTSSPKLSKSSVTVKKGKTTTVKITGKAKGVNNKYTNTKKAKVVSKKNTTTLKIKGLVKGITTLKITVNGVELKLKVKTK